MVIIVGRQHFERTQRVVVVSFASAGDEGDLAAVWQWWEVLHAYTVSSSLSSWSTISQDSDQGTYALETGDDCMGQVMGTKHTTMAFDQVHDLTTFGEAKTLTEHNTSLAEKVKYKCWHRQDTFLMHRTCHLLATDKESKTWLEPMEHGWKELCLKPKYNSMQMFIQFCVTWQNGCHADGVLCIIFCHGTI